MPTARFELAISRVHPSDPNFQMDYESGALAMLCYVGFVSKSPRGELNPRPLPYQGNAFGKSMNSCYLYHTKQLRRYW